MAASFRRWSLLCGLGASCAAAWPSLAFADDAPTLLPTVKVEGERTELQGSGVVIRVPVEPLGAIDLAELLATLPGVQMRSSGGLGTYSEASLRGSSGRQVRVLLDGLPLDTGGGEASSLSLISPLMLDEVEVYKGRVPVGLGSGLAGTINLRSRDHLTNPVVGSAAIGSLGERQLNAAAQLTDSLQLAAGTQQADNDFRYVNKFRAFDPTDPDRTRPEDRQNAGTEQQYGFLRYRGPVRLTAHFIDDQQELPTRLNLPDTRTTLETRSYALAISTPEDTTWQTSLSHRLTRERYRDPISQLGLGEQDSRDDTQTTLFSIGRDFEAVKDALTIEHTEYESEDLLGDDPPAIARRISISNGIEARTGERYRFNAGLRGGWSRDEASGQDDDDHWQFEPEAGVSHDIGRCVAVANVGRRERLPTFFERYGDRGLFRGNPELKPERANFADAGGHCTPEKWVRRIELSVFGQDLHDVISPTYNAQGVGRSINTDRAMIVGVEFSTAGEWSGFNWQLGGTWQHTEDRSDVAAARGQQLPGRYENQINTRIERTWFGITAHYAFRCESGQFYDSANVLPASPVRRHDVGLRGAVREIGWALQWLNLRDDHFDQFNGFPTPGQRVLLSLTYPHQRSTAPTPGEQP